MSATYKYGDWKNYPTWAVKLWLDNEQAHLEQAQEIALECSTLTVAEMDETSLALGDYWKDPENVKAARVRRCAKRIQELTLDIAENDGASMAADLLGWAIQQVDFREIAESYLSDLVTA